MPCINTISCTSNCSEHLLFTNSWLTSIRVYSYSSFYGLLSGIIKQCQIYQNACSLNVWCACTDSVQVWSRHFITHTLPLWTNWRLSRHLKVIHTTWPRGSVSLCGIRYVKIQSNFNDKVRHDIQQDQLNCFQVLAQFKVWIIMTHYWLKIDSFILPGGTPSLAFMEIHVEPYSVFGVSTGFNKL